MSRHIYPINDRLVGRQEREAFLQHKSRVFWMTGLSGSGKSTIAQRVERELFHQGYFAQVIDGDDVRSGLCNNLGFSIDDRAENIRRVAEVAKLYVQSGVIVLCSFVSPTIEIRAQARKIIGEEDFDEVYINTPLAVCERRDVKGLYKKARAGIIKGFTGIDSPFEPPVDPDLEIKTEYQTIDQSALALCTFIIEKTQL